MIWNKQTKPSLSPSQFYFIVIFLLEPEPRTFENWGLPKAYLLWAYWEPGLIFRAFGSSSSKSSSGISSLRDNETSISVIPTLVGSENNIYDNNDIYPILLNCESF